MKNNNLKKKYSTGGIKKIKLNIIFLMKKIQNKIDSSAAKIKTSRNNSTNKINTKIAILKNHELNLKESLKWLETMNHTEWIEHKADVVRDIELAYIAFEPQNTK